MIIYSRVWILFSVLVLTVRGAPGLERVGSSAASDVYNGQLLVSVGKLSVSYW